MKKLTFIFALLVAFAAPAFAQISYDTKANSGGCGSSPCTWTHVTGSTGSPALVVTGFGEESLASVACTYNSVSMTNLGDQIDPDSIGHTVMLILAGPATGSHSVSCTNGAGFGGGVEFESSTYFNVNQSTPNRTIAKASGTSTQPSVVVSNAVSGDYVVDSLFHYQPSGITITGHGASQTQLFITNNLFSSSYGGAGSYESATGSTTMSWTVSATTGAWAMEGIALEPGTVTVATPTFSLAGGTFTSGLPQSTTAATSTSGAYLCVTTCTTSSCTPTTPAASTPGTCSTGTQYSTNSQSLTLPVGYETISALGTKSGDTNSAVATSPQYNSVPTVAGIGGNTVGTASGNIGGLGGNTFGAVTNTIGQLHGLTIPGMTIDVHCNTDNGASASTTAACSLASVTAGDLITCEGTVNNASSNAVLSIEDGTNGNYFITYLNSNSSVARSSWHAFFPNAASGTYSPTMTSTNSVASQAISCEAWKGARTSVPLDSAAVTQFTAQTSSTANPTAGSSQSPTGNGELVVASADMHANTPTAGANFSLLDSNATTLLFPEYWVQQSGTATTSPFVASSDTWTDEASAYLPAAASAGVTPFSGLIMNGSGGTNSATITNATLTSSTHGLANGFSWTPATIPSQLIWSNSPSPCALATSRFINGTLYSGAANLDIQMNTVSGNPTAATIFFNAAGTVLENKAVVSSCIYWDMANIDTGTYEFVGLESATQTDFVETLRITGGTFKGNSASGSGGCLTGCSGYAASPNTWYFVTAQYVDGGTHSVNLYSSTGTLLYTWTASAVGTNKCAAMYINDGNLEISGNHTYLANVLINYLNPSFPLVQ